MDAFIPLYNSSPLEIPPIEFFAGNLTWALLIRQALPSLVTAQ